MPVRFWKYWALFTKMNLQFRQSLGLRIFQFKSYFPKYSLGVRPVIFLKRRVK